MGKKSEEPDHEHHESDDPQEVDRKPDSAEEDRQKQDRNYYSHTSPMPNRTLSKPATLDRHRIDQCGHCRKSKTQCNTSDDALSASSSGMPRRQYEGNQ